MKRARSSPISPLLSRLPKPSRKGGNGIGPSRPCATAKPDRARYSKGWAKPSMRSIRINVFFMQSRKALEIWDKKPDDLIGLPFLSAFPHALGTPGYEAHLRALETGEAQHLELVSPLLGRWFEVDIYPSSTGVCVAFRDVEHRKQAEAALLASEARLKAAVELVGLSLYSGDPRTGTLEWNARLKAMWGLPADAPVDAPMAIAAVHPDDQARVAAAWEASLDPTGG